MQKVDRATDDLPTSREQILPNRRGDGRNRWARWFPGRGGSRVERPFPKRFVGVIDKHETRLAIGTLEFQCRATVDSETQGRSTLRTTPRNSSHAVELSSIKRPA
jgi:hypothetical protein